MKKFNIALLIISSLMMVSCKDLIDNIFGEDSEEEEDYRDEDLVSRYYIAPDWSKIQVLSITPYADVYYEFRMKASKESAKIKDESVLVFENDSISAILVALNNYIDDQTGEHVVEFGKGDLADIFANTQFTLATSANGARSNDPGYPVFYPTEITYVNDSGRVISRSLDVDDETHLTGHLWEWGDELIKGGDLVLYHDNKADVRFVKPRFDIDIDIDLSFNFGARTAPQFLASWNQHRKAEKIDLKASIIGKFSFTQMLKASIEGQGSYDKGYEIVRHNLFTPISVRFVVYGVPVIVQVSADLYRQVMLEAEGKLEFTSGITCAARGELGYRWNQAKRNGIEPFNSFNFEVNNMPPTVTGIGHVKGEFHMFPRVFATVYGTIGPSFDLKGVMGSEVELGFSKSIDYKTDSDYMAWELRNYAGVEFGVGLSQMFMHYEVDRSLERSFRVYEKDLYLAPRLITLQGNKPGPVSPGQTVHLDFDIFDKDFTDSYVKSWLPAVVKFDADGYVSNPYAIASDGQVSVDWAPASSDEILSATIYNANGGIITQCTVDTKLEEGTPYTDTEEFQSGSIKSITIYNNAPMPIRKDDKLGYWIPVDVEYRHPEYDPWNTSWYGLVVSSDPNAWANRDKGQTPIYDNDRVAVMSGDMDKYRGLSVIKFKGFVNGDNMTIDYANCIAKSSVYAYTYVDNDFSPCVKKEFVYKRKPKLTIQKCESSPDGHLRIEISANGTLFMHNECDYVMERANGSVSVEYGPSYIGDGVFITSINVPLASSSAYRVERIYFKYTVDGKEYTSTNAITLRYGLDGSITGATVTR